MSPSEPSSPIAALKAAVPYLRRFQGEIFVLKAGGEAFATEESTRRIVEQVGVLHQLGIHVAVVHGGGAQVSAVANTLGIEPTFVDGRRVTCEHTREVTMMVLNGAINTRIVAACREFGVSALGFSGVDGSLIKASKRPPRETKENGTVDYGYVGDIEEVDGHAVHLLLDSGYVPVISPVSAASDGTVLNVNADSVAARLAVEVEARKLILMTGVRGIMRDPESPSSLVSYTDLEGLAELEEEGVIKAGMMPKVDAIRMAIEGGVPRVHVLGFKVPDGLLTEVFTNEGCGTMVVPSVDALPETET